MQKVFSVIVPALNEEDFLPKLLQSLKEQVEQNFEVIVVDGVSDDTTVRRCEEFYNEFPLTILSTSRRNVSYQRNIGARKAKGSYLIFLDADARVFKDFTYELSLFLKNNPTEEMLLPSYESDNKEITYKVGVEVAQNIGTSLQAIGVTHILTCLMVLSKQLFTALNGFNEEVVFGEDQDLVHRAFKLGYKVKLVKKSKVYISMRRWEKEGKFNYLKKIITHWVHVALHGRQLTKKFTYEMGGQHYKKR